MDFYKVLEKRRTYRDFSEREVSDEILERIISAAFKAPTNDHLRQLEFVVVRGRENIARVTAPLAKNMEAFKDLVFEVDESGDKDKMEMFADALPKQQKMLMESGLLIIPFFRQMTCPLLKPAEQSSLNYFASAWCALENMLLGRLRIYLSAYNRLPDRECFFTQTKGNMHKRQDSPGQVVKYKSLPKTIQVKKNSLCISA